MVGLKITYILNLKYYKDFLFEICSKRRKIVEYNVGDIVRTKKVHPCGSKLWELTRVGVDFKMKCQGCGHLVVLDRQKALKIITKNETSIKKSL